MDLSGLPSQVAGRVLATLLAECAQGGAPVKGILIVLVGFVLIVLVGGVVGDDDNTTPSAPPVGVHNPNHDCDWKIADAILRGEMGGRFYGNPALCRVTWYDGNYVLICQNGRPQTLFPCHKWKYINNSLAQHGEAPISADEARGILGWPVEALVCLGVVGLFGWIWLTSPRQQVVVCG
jgi:hypothetical protein